MAADGDGEHRVQMSRRDQFLIMMYEKLWDNIDRHLSLVWESAAVLGGATAVFALTEKGVLSLDVASSLLVIVAAWVVAHAYDANGWYNRNLAIIANIERQFLNREDAQLIHPFFMSHRRARLIEHLGIQTTLGYAFASIILAYHWSVRVWPGHSASFKNFEIARACPYIALVCSGGMLVALRQHYISRYERLIKESPGLPGTSAPESRDGVATVTLS